MKVNPESTKVTTPLADTKAQSAKTPSTATGTAAPSQSTPGAASIDISSASRGLQSANGSDPASFDAARVDQIKQAITEGRFQVNAHVVADKLIASAQDLVSAASGKGH